MVYGVLDDFLSKSVMVSALTSGMTIGTLKPSPQPISITFWRPHNILGNEFVVCLREQEPARVLVIDSRLLSSQR